MRILRLQVKEVSGSLKQLLVIPAHALKQFQVALEMSSRALTAS